METIEEIKARAEATVPGARLEIIANGSPANQPSLLLDREHATAVVQFLRDDPALRLDLCSNVTGIDWLDRTVTKKVKVKTIVEGEEREIEEAQVETFPGYLEAVYHLYSVELKHGPVVIRLRTADRANAVHLPSLTPLYRSAELQEREIFDLYGIHFDGHPDLRRILMYPEFIGHPLRRDYPAEKIQPLVQYREVENIDKLAPFGLDEGMSFGRQTHAGVVDPDADEDAQVN